MNRLHSPSFRCSFLFNNHERCDAMAISDICHFCSRHVHFSEHNYPVSRQRDNFNFIFNHNLDRLYELFSDEPAIETQSLSLFEAPITNTANERNGVNYALNDNMSENIQNEETEQASGRGQRNDQAIQRVTALTLAGNVGQSLTEQLASPTGHGGNPNLFPDAEEEMYRNSHLCCRFGHSYCSICFCEKIGVYMKCCAEKQFLCSGCYLDTLKTRLNDKKILTPNMFEIYKQVIVELFSVQCPYCRSFVRVEELPAE